MAFEALLAEYEARRAKALAGGGADKYAKRTAKGILNARERIAKLVDAESFIEKGSASQRASAVYEDVTPVTKDGLSNFVNWQGLIDELTENKIMQDQGKSFSERISE